MQFRTVRVGRWVLSVVASVALVWSTGCASHSAESATEAMTQAPDGTVILDEGDDGMTFDVLEGHDVVVRLSGNPSTGYAWTVGSTDRTFGYPQSEEFLVDEGGPVGSGGIYEFLWATDGPLSMVGAHTVVMNYGRSWEEEPAETFTFTINVLAAEPSGEESLVIDETGDGKTYDAVAGTEVVVRLGGNPSTGYEWTVASTDCTFGYPQSEEFLVDGEGPTGSGGIYELVWATAGPLPMEGAHTVVLQYKRSWEDEPAETFTFTVNILSAESQE